MPYESNWYRVCPYVVITRATRTGSIRARVYYLDDFGYRKHVYSTTGHPSKFLARKAAGIWLHQNDMCHLSDMRCPICHKE